MADRPHYTAEQMIGALQRTKGMVTLAADHLGCTYHTVENYVKRYPSVAEALKRERERILDITELKLVQAINDGEAWAIQFMLKTQGKQRGYVERHEITGKDGESLQIHLSWGDASYETEDHLDHPPATPSRPALRAAASGEV